MKERDISQVVRRYAIAYGQTEDFLRRHGIGMDRLMAVGISTSGPELYTLPLSPQSNSGIRVSFLPSAAYVRAVVAVQAGRCCFFEMTEAGCNSASQTVITDLGFLAASLGGEAVRSRGWADVHLVTPSFLGHCSQYVIDLRQDESVPAFCLYKSGDKGGVSCVRSLHSGILVAILIGPRGRGIYLVATDLGKCRVGDLSKLSNWSIIASAPSDRHFLDISRPWKDERGSHVAVTLDDGWVADLTVPDADFRRTDLGEPRREERGFALGPIWSNPAVHIFCKREPSTASVLFAPTSDE